MSVEEEYSLEAGDVTRCGREAKSGTGFVSDSNKKRAAEVEGTGECTEAARDSVSFVRMYLIAVSMVSGDTGTVSYPGMEFLEYLTFCQAMCIV